MTEQPRSTLLAHLRHLLVSRAVSNLDDDLLLERFVGRRDEQAFVAVVQRHGPLVLSVCRRALRDEQDVEDAFQATFLILAQRAGSIRNRELLPSWLYGVAQRVARRAREQRQRREAQQRTLDFEPGQTPPDNTSEMRAVLDEEIQRLPDKYRLPVILCYVQERTNDEAARLLGCPRGTVATRLNRAREKLRARLERRGLALSLALLPGVPAPPDWVTRTARLAVLLASGAPADLSPVAQTLMQGVLRDMNRNNLKLFAAALFAVALAATTIVLAATPKEPPAQTPPTKADKKPDDRPAEAWKAGKPFAAFKGQVRLLALSPDGKHVLTAGDPDDPFNDNGPAGSPELWDAATGKKKTALAQGGAISNAGSLAFSADGKTAAVADVGVSLWDVAGGKMLASVNENVTVTGLAFSPDGKTLAVVRSDGYLRLYPWANGKLGKPRTSGQVNILSLSAATFTADGSKVVTVGPDGTVRTWDPATLKPVTTVRLKGNNACCTALSPDGLLAGVGAFDGSFAVYDAATGKEKAAWPKQGKDLISQMALAFSADGKQILVGQGKQATLWDVATQKVVFTCDGAGDALTAVHISADGRSLAVADRKGRVTVVTKSTDSQGKKP